MERFAKIVCTLGPSSETKEQITALVKAGYECRPPEFFPWDA